MYEWLQIDNNMKNAYTTLREQIKTINLTR